MSSFKNKRVLITGGGSGIGFLMVKKALQQNAERVIIWDVDRKKLAKAKERLNNFLGRLYTYKVDVSDPEQIYQTANSVLKQLSHVDILINNAGIVVGKEFAKHSPIEIENSLNINLGGVIHCTRALLPHMMDRNTGHIVNIASAAGLMPNPNMSVYAGSKWGVIGWSESLRIELNQRNSNIRVTTIEPSFINTGMFDGVTPPLLTPFLDADDITDRIIRAVEKNKIHLRAPFMVKLLPFLRGILPARVFDFVAGNLFQVYESMDTFKGRTDQKNKSV